MGIGTWRIACRPRMARMGFMAILGMVYFLPSDDLCKGLGDAPQITPKSQAAESRPCGLTCYVTLDK